MRTTKLEIEDWMSACYSLSGIQLIVYALIYSETELSINKVAKLLNLPLEEAQTIVNGLTNEGYLIRNFVPVGAKELYKDSFVGDETGRLYTYTVNEDLLL